MGTSGLAVDGEAEQPGIVEGRVRLKRAEERIQGLEHGGTRADNDGVHRVAAGGCSKNRKPAGGNSGATACYVVCGIPSTALM